MGVDLDPSAVELATDNCQAFDPPLVGLALFTTLLLCVKTPMDDSQVRVTNMTPMSDNQNTDRLMTAGRFMWPIE